jgi:hypothetical protein
MATHSRSHHHEVWSRTETGSVEKHGAAFGVTFEDACKHLAAESVDFWTYFDRGYYRGRRLYPSRSQALAAVGPDRTE